MSVWDQLAASALAEWIQVTPYVYAFLEGVHLIGIAFFFGSLFVLDLRLLGVARRMAVRPAARQILPLTLASFVLVTISGVLLFLTNADRYVASTSFLVKVVLMIAGGVNLFLFHTTVWRRVDGWGAAAAPVPLSVKLFGGTSIAVWLGALIAGRWLGYEPRPDEVLTDIDFILPPFLQ